MFAKIIFITLNISTGSSVSLYKQMAIFNHGLARSIFVEEMFEIYDVICEVCWQIGRSFVFIIFPRCS
jgi:hypothetical protein